VETLEEQLLKYGHLFAWSIARVGAWGYMAITALAGLGLEVASHRTSQYWHRLISPLDALLEPSVPQEEQMLFYGYDEQGQPVYDPQTPVAYTPDGTPVPGYRSMAVDAAPGATGRIAEMDQPEPEASTQLAGEPTEVIDAPGSLERPPFAPVASEQNGAGQQAPTPRPLFEPAPLSCPPRGLSTPLGSPAPRPDHSRLRDVIGGAAGTQVSLATALADQEQYFVDPATGQVWDRQYWEQLHGQPSETADRKAA
jgi:hypothetical protein